MSSITEGGRHRARAGYDDMGAASRILEKDEEMGKRDEDFKGHRRQSAWSPLRYRKKRILVTCLVLLAVYFLFQVLLSDTSSSPLSPDLNDDGVKRDEVSESGPGRQPAQPVGAPPKKDHDPSNPAAKHYYNEVIKFYKLGGSLHRISRTQGHRPNNHNILFAASSLKSVSTLLPLACEMRRWDRNHVHFALFGRDDLSIEEIQEVNGINKDNCDLFWHDARPDYAEYSTDLRAEIGANFAFKNINEFMHPQALITDQLDRENAFFQHSVRKTIKDQGHPLIQIPEDGDEAIMWMTRLDSESLKAWHRPTVDILIHAPPNSIGSLRRLVKSLKEADYTGLAYPRLILEIPTDIDHMIRAFLEQLQWPPKRRNILDQGPPDKLVIRHRIPSKKISAEEASVRFAESFYPSHPDDSHVLVMSPQAQVSPLYFQYVMYSILEYKHARYQTEGINSLLGFSLDVPSTLLDGSKHFIPPTTNDLSGGDHFEQADDAPIPFIWEAPSSGAALYFGDKWVEIQSCLTNRIDRRSKAHSKRKEVSAMFPAWMEYFLELIRSRGYIMLYPGLSSKESLVTVHSESSHLPEEYSASSAEPASNNRQKRDEPEEAKEVDLEAFVTPVTPLEPQTDHDVSDEERPLLTSSGHSRPLHQVLPFKADLPGLSILPYLAANGEKTSRQNAARIAVGYADHFRGTIGGCQNNEKYMKGWRRKMVKGSARDLFCWGDEGEDDWYEPMERKVLGWGAPADTGSDGLREPDANAHSKPDADTADKADEKERSLADAMKEKLDEGTKPKKAEEKAREAKDT